MKAAGERVLPEAALAERPERVDYEGKKTGMWLFLFTEILFFGGLFVLYAMYRARYAAAFHAAAAHENLVLGTVNTAVLLTSSCSMAIAISSLQRGRRAASMVLQAATIAGGVAFLVIKYFEWSAKFAIGLYPNSPVLLALGKGQTIFFGLYYIMTGLHGLHVLAGITAIAIMLGFTQRRIVHGGDAVRLENTGLYWHFVDVVWIYLFPFFYLVT
jgi:cytochrome c oxidase subunit III